MVCFLSKYLKSYNFGKRTNSKKGKPVSDSVTRNLHKKFNRLKKQFGVYQCYTKAFDTVCRPILLQNLQCSGTVDAIFQ